MNNQQLMIKIMSQLKTIYPQGVATFKGDENAIKGYLEQMELGLIENELLNPEFIKLGFKRMRSRDSSFYPSVGEFISACMPRFEDYNLPTAEEARLKAAQCAYSHLKCNLEPLVQMAAKGHWAALGEGKGNKEFHKRYLDLFNKYIRGQIELESMPKPIEKAPPTEQERKESGKVGREVLKNLMGGLNE